MEKSIFTALCLIIVSGAKAQSISIEDLTSCKRIEDSLVRLTCYDDLADSVTVAATQGASAFEKNDKPVEGSSQKDGDPLATAWTLVESIDPISDNNVSRTYLDADSRRGGNAAPEFFMLACDGDGGSSIFMGTTGYIGNMRGRTSVEYRWGDNDPVSERWEGSTNGKAAFLPSGYRDFRSGLEGGG